jgi:hypothetical protein
MKRSPMNPSLTIRRVLALALALALMAGACGGGDGDEDAGTSDTKPAAAPVKDRGDEEGGADIAEGGSDEKADIETVEFDDALPVSARYGDVEFTVESAEVTATLPKDMSVYEESDAYAVLEVTAESVAGELNTLPVYPTDIFTLVVDKEEFPVVDGTGLGYFELTSADAQTIEVAFPVEPTTDLSDGALVIQELADDPEEARVPVELPLNGDEPTELPEPVALALTNGDEIAGRVSGDSVTIHFESADLAGSIGVNEDDGTWPGDEYEGMRQPREGELFLRVILTQTAVEDSPVGCGAANYAVYAEDGEVVGEPVGYDGDPITVCPGAPSEPEYYTFVVPDDRDTYEIQFMDGDKVLGSFIVSR